MTALNRTIPMRLFHAALILLVLLAGLVVGAKPSFALSYGYYAFPQGELGIARPNIGVTLNLSEGRGLESYHLYLNNKEVPLVYDQVSITYTYPLEEDLTPGVYKAQFAFTISGYQPSYINWEFTVSQDAVALSTDVNREQEEGLRAINDYRSILGLSPVKFHAALNTAAQKHAEYLYANKIDPINTPVSMHDENPALPGYIGQSLGDRMQYVGYGRAGGEDVAFIRGSLVEAIDNLYDAPYHRTPFLVPSLAEVGIYKKGDYHVVEFGYAEGVSPELVVSPASGDIYVPTAFYGDETPDPMRFHSGTDYPVGYPIMAGVYGPKVEKVSLLNAALKDEEGRQIAMFTNAPGKDDHLEQEVILLPQKPLELDTVYSAKVELSAQMTDGSTQLFSKEWSFRTEPTHGIGVQKLHADSVGYKLQMANFGLNRGHTVTFGLDDGFYTLDTVKYTMRQRPHILDGSSYLYIRDLAAALGAEVQWDDARRAAIYTKKDKQITFFTTRNAYAINGVEYDSPTPAKLIGETTMIPVRLLSETLGAKVSYTERTRTVTISY